MGKSSQTQKTSSTTVNSTPQWIQDQVQGVSGQIGGLTGTDPYSYVAPWNNVQQTAVDRLAGLGNGNAYTTSAADTLNLVGNYKAPSVSAASLLDNLDQYMSPYTGQVVDTTLASFDRNAGQQAAQAQAARAGSSAFNSSRAGIAEGELLAGQGLNRAMTEAGLRDQGFRTGADLSGQDAMRRQQASSENAALAMQKQQQGLQIAQLLAQMGAQTDATTLSGANSLLNAGNTMYDVNQAQVAAPLSVAQSLAGMTGAMPYGLYGTQKSDGKTTTTSTPSTLSMLGTAAMGIGTLMSGGALGGLAGLAGGLGGGVGGLAGMANGLSGGNLGMGLLSGLY